MDGVLADFDGHYEAHFGTRPCKKSDNVDWKAVRAVKDFNLNIPPMADLEALWARIERHNPISTDHQSVENQVRELKQVAERRGWTVEEIYRDAVAWAIDRLGRSLIDLLGTIEHLEKVGVDLYVDQQNIDTTTPTGRLLFQITGAFGEFERSMIRQRVRSGLSVIKVKIERDGKFVSKAGKVRKAARPARGPRPTRSIWHVRS
jgi:Resolvase, N terminal domain